ncbi:hypothetical protein FISHEDRAFT_58067 [Fistulina hepatica ATCC 64428]|uniref:Uncharacterized protein n=1 Tax=Fistulina hepatica ATCC 64428 TaxID=1128425 RepID=A0A0D7AHN5_9AGAR|nr:hypothetical protein FISHEDRAFT_58067 [Fistulina hepatica ATCC 64428]
MRACQSTITDFAVCLPTVKFTSTMNDRTDPSITRSQPATKDLGENMSGSRNPPDAPVDCVPSQNSGRDVVGRIVVNDDDDEDEDESGSESGESESNESQSRTDSIYIHPPPPPPLLRMAFTRSRLPALSPTVITNESHFPWPMAPGADSESVEREAPFLWISAAEFCSWARAERFNGIGHGRIRAATWMKANKAPFHHQFVFLTVEVSGLGSDVLLFHMRADRLGMLDGNLAKDAVTIQPAQSIADGLTVARAMDAELIMHVVFDEGNDAPVPCLSDLGRFLAAITETSPSYYLQTTSCYFHARSVMLLLVCCFRDSVSVSEPVFLPPTFPNVEQLLTRACLWLQGTRLAPSKLRAFVTVKEQTFWPTVLSHLLRDRTINAHSGFLILTAQVITMLIHGGLFVAIVGVPLALHWKYKGPERAREMVYTIFMIHLYCLMPRLGLPFKHLTRYFFHGIEQTMIDHTCMLWTWLTLSPIDVPSEALEGSAWSTPDHLRFFVPLLDKMPEVFTIKPQRSGVFIDIVSTDNALESGSADKIQCLDFVVGVPSELLDYRISKVFWIIPRKHPIVPGLILEVQPAPDGTPTFLWLSFSTTCQEIVSPKPWHWSITEFSRQFKTDMFDGPFPSGEFFDKETCQQFFGVNSVVFRDIEFAPRLSDVADIFRSVAGTTVHIPRQAILASFWPECQIQINACLHFLTVLALRQPHFWSIDARGSLAVCTSSPCDLLLLHRPPVLPFAGRFGRFPHNFYFWFHFDSASSLHRWAYKHGWREPLWYPMSWDSAIPGLILLSGFLFVVGPIIMLCIALPIDTRQWRIFVAIFIALEACCFLLTGIYAILRWYTHLALQDYSERVFRNVGMPPAERAVAWETLVLRAVAEARLHVAKEHSPLQENKNEVLACGYAREALDAFERLHTQHPGPGLYDPERASAGRLLASSLCRQKRFREACSVLNQAVAIAKELFAVHPNRHSVLLGECLAERAVVMKQLGPPEEASVAWQESLTHLLTAQPDEDASEEECDEWVARLEHYSISADSSSAVACAQAAVDLEHRLLASGPTSRRQALVHSLGFLATRLKDADRTDEAIMHLSEAIQLCKEDTSRISFLLIRAVKDIARSIEDRDPTCATRLKHDANFLLKSM